MKNIRFLVAALFLALCGPALAQKTPAQLQAEINAAIVSTPPGVITAPIVNGILNDIVAPGTASLNLQQSGGPFWTVVNVLDPQWGLALCGSSACPVGTGGDDAVPINRAIAAGATNAGMGATIVFPPPPSGSYNICSTPITRPTAAYNSLVLTGSASGGSAIRILPGCASGIQQLIYDPPIAFGVPIADPSRVRMAIQNLRLDAYCIAPHVITSGFDPGFSSENVVYRNAAGGYDTAGRPSSDFEVLGAYEGNLDASNRIENVNDSSAHVCYNEYADFPAFDFYTEADDWVVSAPMVGAELANVAAVDGGGNNFINLHGWGYSGGDGQTNSQPIYNFFTRGYQIFTDVAADSPIVSGGRAQVIPGSNGIDHVSGIAAAGSGGTANTLVTLTGTTGTGTKFKAVGYTNAAGQLAGAQLITVPGSYSVAPSNVNNEPVTSTGGLTGAALKIVVGSGFQNIDSPLVNGVTMEGALGGSTTGWSLGIAVQRFSLTNGQFEYLSSSSDCVVSDAGISTDAVIASNINCSVTAGRLPSIIGQTHIPFVLPSSGSMGNNGALSSITALPTIYPNAYVYMPAGAIASGSAAGWYYAVFSSTTAATLYNNTYTSGTPAIPGTPTPFVTTGPGSYTQTTGSTIAAYALSILGNTIGPNGAVRLNGSWTYNNTSGNKTIAFVYDASTFNTATETTSTQAIILGGFANRGMTNVQASLFGRSPSAVTNTGAPIYTAVDSTTTQPLTSVLELGTATDFVVLENLVVELLPGVP